ncbi:phosphatase domain-containing putative toxin [Arhodomonas sp. AD133]|uniref:phosphatase domain-containing putative toxin n=1 Tax=Arhodomonas sp. AD133 TaxID=3415009 RepID=UPI003EB79230
MTNPLCIDALRLTNGGRIGVTGCPGRVRLFGSMAVEPGGVEQDIARLRHWGATAVLTLLESDELALLDLGDLGPLVEDAGLAWMHCPVSDLSPIDENAFDRAWDAVRTEAHACLNAGGSLVLHCMAGYGRSGVFLARILVERGVPPDESLALVNAIRPGAIQGADQAAYVRALRCVAAEPDLPLAAHLVE